MFSWSLSISVEAIACSEYKTIGVSVNSLILPIRFDPSVWSIFPMIIRLYVFLSSLWNRAACVSKVSTLAPLSVKNCSVPDAKKGSNSR